MVRFVMNSLSAGALAAAVVLSACGGEVRRYEQGGLTVTGVRFHVGEVLRVGGVQVTSSSGPITRFKGQIGIDRSVPLDGQLTDPPDDIRVSIDNSNPSPSVTLGETTFGANQQNVIVHVEVYHGSGTTPVYAETWHYGSGPGSV